MISKNCIKISEMLLVIIDGKRVYDNLEFEDDQVLNISLKVFHVISDYFTCQV